MSAVDTPASDPRLSRLCAMIAEQSMLHRVKCVPVRP